jgi:DNA gyrase/topoisomerase IV subunit A
MDTNSELNVALTDLLDRVNKEKAAFESSSAKLLTEMESIVQEENKLMKTVDEELEAFGKQLAARKTE